MKESSLKTKPCKVCGTVFAKMVNCSKKTWPTVKFCSRNCANKAKIGVILPHNKALFKKGHSSLDGFVHRPDCRCTRCHPPRGNKNNFWKGGRELKKKCLYCHKEFFAWWNRRYESKYCSRGCAYDSWRENTSVFTWLAGRFRSTQLCRDWRQRVLARDRRCVDCGSVKQLDADHIIPLASLIKQYGCLSLKDLMNVKDVLDVKNGRTLCRDCHRKTETWGRKI